MDLNIKLYTLLARLNAEEQAVYLELEPLNENLDRAIEFQGELLRKSKEARVTGDVMAKHVQLLLLLKELKGRDFKSFAELYSESYQQFLVSLKKVRIKNTRSDFFDKLISYNEPLDENLDLAIELQKNILKNTSDEEERKNHEELVKVLELLKKLSGYRGARITPNFNMDLASIKG